MGKRSVALRKLNTAGWTSAGKEAALRKMLNSSVAFWLNEKYAATATDGSTVYPTWIMDCTNQRYAKSSSPTGSAQQVLFSSLIENFSRASSATYFDASGTLQTASTNVPRFTYDPTTLQPLGLLIEESRTNYLLNSAAPATQTVSLGTGTYILWVVGSGSCTAAAGTAVGTGFGTANSSTAVIFTLTTAGTVVFTVSGSLTRFQCENGAFATSFISTTVSAATRAADDAFTDALEWYRASEGTFVVEGLVPSAGFLLGFSQGATGSAPRGHIINTSSQVQLFMADSSVARNVNGSNFSALGTNSKISSTFDASYINLAKDGILATSSVGLTGPFTITRMAVGRRYGFANSYYSGAIKSIIYYPKRLTDSELQRLTM